MRRTTSALIAAVLALMVCLPAQIGQTPKQALSPQMYSQMKGDSDKLDSVIEDQKAMMAQHGRISDKLDNLIPIISANTAHLTAIDQRVFSLEKRLSDHEAGQVAQPVTIAVLETKVDGLVWLARGIVGLLLASLGGGFLWFRKQINGQIRSMISGGIQHQETMAKLEEQSAAMQNVAAKSSLAHEAAATSAVAAARAASEAAEGRKEAKLFRDTFEPVVHKLENGGNK